MGKQYQDVISRLFKWSLAALLLAGIFAATAFATPGLNTGAGPWQWLNPPIQGASINDIDFIDANTGVGVGIGGTVLKTADGGSHWTSYPSGTHYNLWGVDFTDANNGWAVGDYGAALHTTDGGVTWSAAGDEYSAAGDEYSQPAGSLQDVSFADSNVGVIVGGSGVAYYTSDGGATWTKANNINTLDNLTSVQMLDVNTAVAVAMSGHVYRSTNGGAGWSLQTSNTGSNLSDVYFSGLNNGFAVAADNNSGQGRIIRTTDGGVTWEASSPINVPLNGVRVAGDNVLMVAGKNGALRYYTGSLWSDPIDTIATGLNSNVVDSGTTSDLMAIDFPTSSVGYASGAAGIIAKGSNSLSPWSLTAGGDTVSLTGSSFVDASTGWMVGKSSTVIKTEDGGQSWVTDSDGIPPDVDLQDVDFYDSNTGFAVGCQGANCATSGGTSVAYSYTRLGPGETGTWTAMTGVDSAPALYAVSMTSATDGWAVGMNSVAFQTTDGSSWVSTATGIPANIDINDVDTVQGVSNAWAVGQDTVAGRAVILYWNGGNWNQIYLASPPRFLSAIQMVDSSTGFTVGDAGAVYKTTVGGGYGGSWTAQTSGTARMLADVDFSNENNGFAVGDGRVIHTRDGGAHWYAEELGTNVFVFTVSALGDRQAYVGGSNAAVLRALRPYYFTWYDDLNSDNWVLMANPSSSPSDIFFDLFIAGQDRDLSGYNDGTIAPGESITPRYNGVIGGPVNAASLNSDKAIVSQRVLWPKGGHSIEEVLGTDIDRLSDHFYWTWYDQNSPGYTNWVLIANPNPYAVDYQIKIGGVLKDSGSIPSGQNVTPTFPGEIGGPVEVIATVGGAPAAVIASQRVLSDFGTAFNEAVGVPASELSDDYYWPWYDDVGGQNWILLANPNGSPVNYQIDIGGGCSSPGPNKACENGTLQAAGQPGSIRTEPRFGIMNGPVHVTSTGGNIIASQRVIFGPSFGETMGVADLASDYHWSWYDNYTPGMQNWVLVANPVDAGGSVDYAIKIGATTVCDQSSCPADTSGLWHPGALAPGEKVTPVFGSNIGGPVEVTSSGNVIASQRVLYYGYFNEVPGTVLD